jgi:hypothetical protein
MLNSNDQLCDDIIVIADPNHQAVVLHAMREYHKRCEDSERLTYVGRTQEAKNIICMMRNQLTGGTVKP